MRSAALALRALVAAHWRWRVLRGARLGRWQARRAQQIVGYAWQHAPFYRAHWATDQRSAAAGWQTLPVVDKALMMANFDQFNTLGIGRAAALAVALQAEQSRDFSPTVGGVTVGLSSGTSGHRGLFLVSAAEQAMWAGTILARTLHRWRPGYRVAFFLRSNSNLYEQVASRWLEFRYFDLMLPLTAATAALNAYQPDIIVGPPSLLALLADARRAGTLHAQPERLIAVAEVLEPQDRTALATTFGAPVHQIYQCTEGLLAASCRRGSLHVQSDVVALQWELLADGRAVPIVTDLWRTTQPIIRYRLNDVLRLADAPCACGGAFPVIAEIAGRCDDICEFVQPDGQLRPFFPDTIRRMLLLADERISDYQVIQRAPGQLDVYLELPPGASWASVADAVRRSVDATVAQYGCVAPLLAVRAGLPPRPADQKRRRVVRER